MFFFLSQLNEARQPSSSRMYISGLLVDKMSAFTSRTRRLVQYAGGFTINRERACAVNNSRVDDRIDKKKSWRVQQSRDVWGGGWVPLSAETTLKSGVEESTRKHRETYPQLMPAPGGSAPPDTPRHASDTTPTSRVELERLAVQSHRQREWRGRGVS